jgi:RNA polymerase sigma-70 factor (ECF subfamily)
VSAFMAEKLAKTPYRAQTSLMPSPDDGELAERLARGDAWAREALYRKYVQAVWGLALRLTGDRSDAEDVVQDTFAEALRDAAQLRDRGAIRAWLMGVAVHQVHRRFRRRRLLRVLGLDRGADTSLDELAARDTPQDVLAELQKISRELGRLPPKPRIAWTLRFVEGCTLAEVAAYCECSLATAKRQIATAQRRLAHHVSIAGPADD